jgi:uncharacterized protein (DUF58 family)
MPPSSGACHTLSSRHTRVRWYFYKLQPKRSAYLYAALLLAMLAGLVVYGTQASCPGVSVPRSPSRRSSPRVYHRLAGIILHIILIPLL